MRDCEIINGFKIRKAINTDWENLLWLFEDSFERSIKPEVWEWLYYKCPSGTNRTHIAEELGNKKIVGSYSLLPIKLIYNGKLINASLSNNTNTHPDFRGKRIFTRLCQYSLEKEKEFNSEVSIGMPNINSYPGFIKMGWRVLTELPFLVKYGCKAKSHKCVEVIRFDERLDIFIKEISSQFSFMVFKDYKYLNWRTVSRPDVKYRKFIYEEDNDIKGYIILKNYEEQDYKKTHILDIHANSEETFIELLNVAENVGSDSNELNMWTNSYNPYAEFFKDNGFIERPSDDRLIIHYNYGEIKPLEKKAWWFCLADNDVY